MGHFSAPRRKDEALFVPPLQDAVAAGCTMHVDVKVLMCRFVAYNFRQQATPHKSADSAWKTEGRVKESLVQAGTWSTK